jgi:hypothetical protein
MKLNGWPPNDERTDPQFRGNMVQLNLITPEVPSLLSPGAIFIFQFSISSPLELLDFGTDSNNRL